MSKMLHIHNGDSSADTARKANISGQYLVWREALVCGPTPGDLFEDEFLDLRARHLSQRYAVDYKTCLSDLRAQHDALAASSDHEEVVLWFEHDLFCQVGLIYLLNWFAHHQPLQTRLSLICINEFPGVTDFRGLGQLDGQQLASLLATRREVTSAQLSLAATAWQAYSAPEPAALLSLLESDTSALPFLGAALRKHLQRFPSTRNGLGRIQNVALELIAGGQQEFKSLFASFGRREPVYGFGDAQLYAGLRQLATAKTPLLEQSGGGEFMDASANSSSFKLTTEGEAVLAGEQDFLSLNRIDLWLGGVRLNGHSVWLWDEDRQQLGQIAG